MAVVAMVAAVMVEGAMVTGAMVIGLRHDRSCVLPPMIKAASAADRLAGVGQYPDLSWQVLSDGRVGYMHCEKIADCPFPFPYAQLIFLMLVRSGAGIGSGM